MLLPQTSIPIFPKMIASEATSLKTGSKGEAEDLVGLTPWTVEKPGVGVRRR